MTHMPFARACVALLPAVQVGMRLEFMQVGRLAAEQSRSNKVVNNLVPPHVVERFKQRLTDPSTVIAGARRDRARATVVGVRARDT